MLQSAVRDQSAPAVAGDFASSNPRAVALAGPSGLISWGWSVNNVGPQNAGCRIGAFGFIWPEENAGDPTKDLGETSQGKKVCNAPPAGSWNPADASTFPKPDGLVLRASGVNGSIQSHLQSASNYIKAGSPMDLFVEAEAFVENSGARAAAVGDTACASLLDGSVIFVADPLGTIPADHVATKWRAASAGSRTELVKITTDLKGL